MNRPFTGADKVNPSVLRPLERRLAPWILPKVPAWLETYHLTLLTPVWAAGVVGCSELARSDRRWLWGASIMVVLQWFTDHLDGKLGKYRATGLARWGFYVDHMLDWIFIASIVIGYGLLLPEGAIFDLLLMLAVCAGFVVHAMLAFAATETFQTTFMRIGPTELRLMIVVLNAYLVRAGFDGMADQLRLASTIGFGLLIVGIFGTQLKLWRLERTRSSRG